MPRGGREVESRTQSVRFFPVSGSCIRALPTIGAMTEDKKIAGLTGVDTAAFGAFKLLAKLMARCRRRVKWGRMLRMSKLTFDSHRFVKRLIEACMPEAQAEILAEEQARLIDERIATKLDISEVKSELILVKWIVTTVLALAVANFARQFF